MIRSNLSRLWYFANGDYMEFDTIGVIFLTPLMM